MNPARLVFPGLRWRDRSSARDRSSVRDRSTSEVWPDVRHALDMGVGGFVVFGGSVAGMRELVARAHDHAGHPLLFAADLERGAAQQLAGATPLPPPAALAVAGDDAVVEAARITAHDAAASGIGWVLAPVADLDVEPSNPIVGTRSFGADPERVASQVRDWVVALQAEGLHACAKHFPGHGRTLVDSHVELPVVAADRGALEDDLLPFRAAIEAGVRTIMLAHVSYPALDATGALATLSKAIIGFLRNELGFRGIAVTDALMMGAIAASGRSESQAAVAAIGAGCDVLLYPESPEETIAGLAAALDAGDLDEDRVAEAVDRVEAAATECRPPTEKRALRVGPATEPHHDRALKLAVSAIRVLRGSLPGWRPGEAVRLHIMDDDAALAAPPSDAAPRAAQTAREPLREGLEGRGIRLLDEASGEAGAGDLIAIFSEVRAWKSRAGLAAETVRELARLVEQSPDTRVVLFGHPRLAHQIPQADHVACAWCGDPLMQEAAATRLVSGSA